MAMKIKDLTGQKFGNLTVMERADDYISPKGKHYVRWLCKCDCGNTVVVIGGSLKKDSTKSCGCQRNISIGKANKRYNTYDLSNDYGIGYTSKGEEFYFDLEDYNKIKDYCWYKNKKGYIVASAREDGKSKAIFMHRVVMGFPEKIYDVDHIHGNCSISDNRKDNLRIATRSQNLVNKGLMPNNTSGVTGVHWNKSKKKWEAYVNINCKSVYLGSYNKFEDAVKVREVAEEKYYGEFRYDNNNSKQLIIKQSP
jgi:hypothetical protein